MRRDHSRLRFGVLLCLALGKVILLGGCGSSHSSSTVAVLSAKEYAEGARKLEENNKRRMKEAAAAWKAARARR